MKTDLQNPIFHERTRPAKPLRRSAGRTVRSARIAAMPILRRCRGRGQEALAPSRPAYCNACKGQFTVTVGTVFERSKCRCPSGGSAMHLMGSSKKGMSAHQLMRIPGPRSYRTAWFMAHRIREAMKDLTPAPMGGEGKQVEADETYFGKRENPRPSKHRKGRPYTSGQERLRTSAPWSLWSSAADSPALPCRDANGGERRDIMVRNIRRESGLTPTKAASTRRPASSSPTIRPQAQRLASMPATGGDGPHKHGRGLYSQRVQARHEGRLSALRRNASAPLPRRIRFPLQPPRQHSAVTDTSASRPPRASKASASPIGGLVKPRTNDRRQASTNVWAKGQAMTDDTEKPTNRFANQRLRWSMPSKSIVEIMIVRGIAAPAKFEQLFQHQFAGYLQNKILLGASVFGLLLQFVSNKDRNREREAIRRLLNTPPQGSG